MCGHHALRAVAHERRCTREEFICEAAPRVQVGAPIHVAVACDLLRRHVCRCPDGHSRLRQRRTATHRARCGQRLGDAEVRHHRRAMRQQHVVRLDVAMHDAARVCVRQRARDVAQNADALGDGQCRRGAQSRAERFALHERHREIRNAVGVTSRQQRNDVRLAQRRGELDLAREPVEAHARGHVAREHLDHDITPEPVLAREEDLRHAAAAEFPLDGVAVAEREAEARLRISRHRRVVTTDRPPVRRDRSRHQGSWSRGTSCARSPVRYTPPSGSTRVTIDIRRDCGRALPARRTGPAAPAPSVGLPRGLARSRRAWSGPA